MDSCDNLVAAGGLECAESIKHKDLVSFLGGSAGRGGGLYSNVVKTPL